MSELLTAKDVELKIFKKASFGGYSVPDVEEFLNQIAEDLEGYVLRLGEQQRRIYELEEALKKHEAMKDTIKDALILAQKSARDKEDEARHQAELIVAKAESRMGDINAEARRRLEEAESAADDIVAAARTAAAQITKSAEEIRDEAQRRFAGAEEEIQRRMAEANERANEITASARSETRRLTGKVLREIEESRSELENLRMERLRFLEESMTLAASFGYMIEEARKKLAARLPDSTEPLAAQEGQAESERTERAERMERGGSVTLPFYPLSDKNDGEVQAVR